MHTWEGLFSRRAHSPGFLLPSKTVGCGKGGCYYLVVRMADGDASKDGLRYVYAVRWRSVRLAMRVY